MQQSELVFAYGSNMDPAQMRERCPESDLSWFVARAVGYRLCFPRESTKRQCGVGSIVAAPEDAVWGVVFSVTNKDLERLDGFEGVSTNAYRRERCTVRDSSEIQYVVWTYLANPQTPGTFLPSKEYIEFYIQGATYFGLPADYIKMLRTIRTKPKK